MSNQKLKQLINAQGNFLFGVSNVRPFRTGWIELPEEATAGLNYGISIGIPLSKRVLSSVISHPTKLYAYHYKQINYFLDRMGVLVTNYIQSQGHNALPVPASQTIDHAKLRGHLSHKEIAIAAGLGWKGRNNLVVNPEYGSGIRLVTILTDMPLEVNSPLEQDCGTCQKCITACPAGSVKQEPKDFDLTACHKKLCEFQKLSGIGHHICGICVKSCVSAHQ